MSINWKIRFKNKAFWIAIVPAILLFIAQVADIFGFSLDFTVLQSQILSVIETIFVILAIVGVVTDPTTDDWSDSARALTYTEPAGNIRQSEAGE